MKDKRLTSVPKLPSRSIPRISYPISLRRLQVPCAQFEPLIHGNEGDAESSLGSDILSSNIVRQPLNRKFFHISQSHRLAGEIGLCENSS